MKKTLSLILALVLLSTLALPFATASAEEEKPFAGLEVTILSTTWSPYTTDTTLIPAIEEATGAKITVEWALTTDFDTRVNTTLASGNIPDVIMGASYVPLIEQGAIIPLDDYLTEENAPNILAALEPEDYAFLRNASDGHIYQLPSVFNFPEINSWSVRTDWMEKLGIESLDTWEDWLTYWRGIRDNDMNGNGDATDEMPYCWEYQRLRSVFMPTATSDTSTAYNVFCITDDGEYVVIYEHPNYKTYLEWMVQLYAEGILTSENLTLTSSEFKTIASSDRGGSLHAAAEWAMQITESLRQINPDATMGCVAPITSPLGDQTIGARAKVSTRGVLTVAAEDRADQIVALFDWLYSEEGANLINYGIEGVHHEVVDGQKKLLSPYIDSFVNARGAGLIFQPFPFLWYSDNYLQILLNGKSYEELSDTQKIFYDGLFLNDPYFVTVAPQLNTDAFAAYGTDVFNTLTEAEANCIIGNISIDEFWAIYEDVKANMGLDEIIEQATAAYALVSAQ